MILYRSTEILSDPSGGRGMRVERTDNYIPHSQSWQRVIDILINTT